MAAMSLSEFVDSMIVANLLGDTGMAIVQMGQPIMLIAATAYMLIGSGGSVLYSIALGERDNDKAGVIFGISTIASVVIGVFLLALEMIFYNPMAELFCKNAGMLSEFKDYLFVLCFSTPFFVIILTFVCFLAPAGNPDMSTAINIIANVVNILMDFVYIGVFKMGVKGAAWATLTGYLVASAFAFIALRINPVDIKKKLPGRKDLFLVNEIFLGGLPFAMTQLGYVVKVTFCNNLAESYGSKAGIVAFSLCFQSLSLISIFLAAVMEASAPVLAMLHGQKDYQGEKHVLNLAILMQLIFAGIGTVYFIGWPEAFGALYKINVGADGIMAIRALRIFSLMYIFRGFYITFMKYAQILGYKLYATCISMFDGFIGIIIFGTILCRAFGINGLWWAYPVIAVTMTVLCIAVNLILAARSKGTLSGILLYENDTDNAPMVDLTLLENGEEITGVSKKLQDVCLEQGIASNVAMKAALAVEEMAVFTRNRQQKKDYMDILARAFNDRVEIDFRSIGGHADPNAPEEGDIEENLKVLSSLAERIEYDTIMGMNCVRIVIPTN